MVEKRIEKANTYIDVKYDETKYQIEHVKNLIILRRLSDNQTLEVFNHNIGFIVEYDDEDKIHFIMTDYSEYLQDRNEPVKLKHYVDIGDNELKLLMETNCNDSMLESMFITDRVYSTGGSASGEYLYNLKLKCLSKKFHRIYHDKRISELFGNNTILVSEIIKSRYRSEIKDTIIYGINPETFEIVTPIYSELQDRYIKVYTDEQIEEIDNNLRKQGKWLNRDYNPGKITISLEIEHYLEELAYYIPNHKRIYLDYMNEKINEEFVKKFVR